MNSFETVLLCIVLNSEVSLYPSILIYKSLQNIIFCFLAIFSCFVFQRVFVHRFPVMSDLHWLGSVDRNLCRQKSGCMEKSAEQHLDPTSIQLNGVGKKKQDHSIVLAKKYFDKSVPLKKKVD